MASNQSRSMWALGSCKGCVLPPLLFIVSINWIDKCNQADECDTIGNCKISRLLFADDSVLLSSTESGFQRALNIFADSSDTARIKISTAKTEVLRLSRNPDQCVLPANVATLKRSSSILGLYLRVNEDKEQYTRIVKATEV